MFKGSIVALVTPMHSDGSIDRLSLQALVEWHIASKTDALVIAGTTGESATLNADEQAEILKLAIKQARGRIPVIAGTGSNATATALKLTENAKQAGADACLVVTPYYNKPTQAGLYQHYKMIADKVNLPLILYNVPGRTGCDLLPETVAQLAALPNIIGIKEASGKVERTRDILLRCGTHFLFLSGDDANTLDIIKHGGHGVISVTANVAPEKMHEMVAAALNNEITRAEQLNTALMPLHQHLFIESNPIPTKWALHKMGKIEAGIRLPLLPLEIKYHAIVQQAMQHAGVL